MALLDALEEDLKNAMRARDDLVQKEKAELGVIQRYLPEQLSEEESRSIVQEAIATVGASSKQDLGRVMKEVMSKHRGRVDGARPASGWPESS